MNLQRAFIGSMGICAFLFCSLFYPSNSLAAEESFLQRLQKRWRGSTAETSDKNAQKSPAKAPVANRQIASPQKPTPRLQPIPTIPDKQTRSQLQAVPSADIQAKTGAQLTAPRPSADIRPKTQSWPPDFRAETDRAKQDAEKKSSDSAPSSRGGAGGGTPLNSASVPNVQYAPKPFTPPAINQAPSSFTPPSQSPAAPKPFTAPSIQQAPKPFTPPAQGPATSQAFQPPATQSMPRAFTPPDIRQAPKAPDAKLAPQPYSPPSYTLAPKPFTPPNVQSVPQPFTPPKIQEAPKGFTPPKTS